MASWAQKEMEPKDTEVWEPEPKVIDPYGNYGAPSDAILLLQNGLTEWTDENGNPAKWTYKNGIITVSPGQGGIFTKRKFQDFQLHIEWSAPDEIDEEVTGQGRGNSGVFLQKYYEVQILDSYKNRTYSNGQAASLYKQSIPLVNAMLPPGSWQKYDIIYKAPRFDSNGNLLTPAYITVLHNGVLVQNHVQLKGKTVYIGHPRYEPHESHLPIMLQDHGNLIRFRNIWVREL